MVYVTTSLLLTGDAEPSREDLTFGRTATATRLHLSDCPHLVGKDWHAADQAGIDGYPLCQWSRDQLEGLGRLHPETLEDAMRVHGTPAGAVALIKEHLKFVTYDEIWLPYSLSYAALGLDGRAVASFGKSYVEVGEGRVDLPGYVAGRASGRSHRPTYGGLCPNCFLLMPLTGICDDCD